MFYNMKCYSTFLINLIQKSFAFLFFAWKLGGTACGIYALLFMYFVITA
jgi:hypothetical protein